MSMINNATALKPPDDRLLSDVESEIEYVVDIDPYKHGTYIAGTGQAIVSPDSCASTNPMALS